MPLHGWGKRGRLSLLKDSFERAVGFRALFCADFWVSACIFDKESDRREPQWKRISARIFANWST